MDESATSEAFEAQRGRLTGLAARVLGSRTDAEDAVQEAWLRLSRQDPDSIDNLSGWLSTVVGRVCLDMLRSRRAKGETPWEEPGREWLVSDDVDDPEGRAELSDTIGVALLMVLESLTPDERLAFILHDTFAVPFDEIARILGKSPDAARMLGSRARRKVRGAEPPSDRRRQREVVDAFLAAAREGDFDALLRVLDPDVVWRVHTPRGVTVRLGASELARHAALGRRTKTVARRVDVDGMPGVMAWREDGTPLAVMACVVVDGRIVQVDSLLRPERQATIAVAPPAVTSEPADPSTR
ncbi:sigma-70 family RNA polymerase sigma factor [Leifsonia naganoensis]|uniref:RNA polymerase sigma-70 factor (ECF subfamily) n=1 Tax=Leifsonia naganoensis TaxID=150025 RepID=A0A853DRE2_9MICO|nr:sigma-70 family RNA polymerase sigma factor [Leifsonia naganoensis]NYK10203.1 RNA polymerase sigma-70 factor (ECF subfamily) [Leifsonia naganoensis]